MSIYNLQTIFGVILIILFLYILSVISTASSITNNTNDSQLHHQEYYTFPDAIPIFNVRKDKDTGLEVSRGRLNDLGGY